jgi:hypothetical protein
MVILQLFLFFVFVFATWWCWFGSSRRYPTREGGEVADKWARAAAVGGVGAGCGGTRDPL